MTFAKWLNAIANGIILNISFMEIKAREEWLFTNSLPYKKDVEI